ncbi:MAG: SMP-30/gluconolactonase/LRE family protein, partial [Aldersonia sp.]|nr:SMP-30/gluconolactonase/LRE family protein [Aldersonia sp.]
GLPMPNGMEVGPDGKLYYPLLGANEIWRIDPEGGEPERVAADLGGPDAVKFDAQGNIVSTQVGSGQVLRIDPRSGETTLLAQLSPGLDNLTFVGDRLFVSSFTGKVTEIFANGETSAALPDGLTWPLDLTVGTDGTVYIADGTFLLALAPGGELQTLGMLFSPGWPGYIRGLIAVGDGEFVVTSSEGQVSRYRPASSESELVVDGLGQLYGVAVGSNGTIATVDLAGGRVYSITGGNAEVVAADLREPIDVAFAPDGALLVAESAAGRIVRVTGSGTDTIVDGLETPHGILVHNGQLFIVDVGAKQLVSVDLDTKAREVVAHDLPVGAPPGVTPKPLLGLAPFSGPQGPLAGIAAGPDGTLYVSGDAEGSVLALRKSR